MSSGIVVGFSGSRRTFELFQTRMQEYMFDYAQKEGNSDIHEIRVDKILLQISEITRDIYSKFRLQNDYFDILVAVSPVTLHKNRFSDSSFLKYFYENGTLETVNRYKAIGNGAPFGSIYLKQNWRPDMTMKHVAEIGYFIIRYIEKFYLDMSVGVDKYKPQIWFIADNEVDYCADARVLDELEEKTESNLKRIEENRLHKLF